MRPVVTPDEMRAIDAEAPDGVEVLIERAGWAVARSALGLLGGRYGRRVAVVAGPGNNGADGRVAARVLGEQGVRCSLVEPTGPIPASVDLVVDAAFGTGLSRPYRFPPVPDQVPVLAVDIPSGLDGLTGRRLAGSEPPVAARTVTFAAIKPGLVLGDGPDHSGIVEVADIGLDCARARAHLLGPDDLAQRWPRRTRSAHKWRSAVWVVGGSPGMVGAPALVATAALRAGAGYAAVTVAGDTADAITHGPPLPVEAVGRPSSSIEPAELARFGAILVGPGLRPDAAGAALVNRVVAGSATTPLVLDGGALDVVAAEPDLLRDRDLPAVLTPHRGELDRLLTGVGHPRADESADDLATVRRLAADLGAVVVAKGPTTIVADPDGSVLLSVAGDRRLATAGTGDSLVGAIGAALAGGVEPWLAGGLGAELHGRAAANGRPVGFVAHDLPELMADLLGSMGSAR